MKHWIFAALTLLLATNGDARERWGPPPACPKPKADCCPKPKPCNPKPCPPKPCKPKCAPKPCDYNPCKPKCEPCEPPCPKRCEDLQPAFNKCAAIDIDCGWNLWVDGSFIYWEAMQDNMEFAVSASGDLAAIATNGPSNGDIIRMDYGYEPGFKVGLGMTSSYDCWDFFAEYTWFRSTQTKTASSPTPGTLMPMVHNPTVSNGNAFASVDSKWHVSFDLLDAAIGRSYYVGKKLTFRPFCGVRAAWISQDWDTTFTNPGSHYITNQDLKSWGVGPEIGIDTHWNLCYGLRLYGQAEGDVLFTRYTTINTFDENTPRLFNISGGGNNTLRGHVDLELGLGWGMYLNCYKWYIDLAAGYGFQIFFDQNMFREYQQVGVFSSVPGGNLYLHGLTTTLKIEF